MTRTSRFALFALTALVAACLFSVSLFAQKANADVAPALTASFLQNGTATGVANPAPGSHYDFRQLTNITTSNGDDIQRLTLDYPSGLIGDPNAILPANRCNIDYTTVTATSGSPSYAGCPASSKVGTIKAVASSGLTCSDISLSGSIYLLRNRPSANPEVPAHLGINLSGTANIWLLFCAGAGVNLNMTGKIALRPTDQGLRIQIIDDITRTDPIIGGAIQIKSIDQTISGMAPAPSTKPFLTLPTRCTTWDTKVYTRAYSSNGNVDTDLDPAIAGNDHKVSTSTTTPSCAAPAAYNPTFTLTQTNTQAGRPVGLLAVLDNPVVTTNTLQSSYAKQFDLTLPVGMKINPAIANRLGAVGCTEPQFLVPGNGLPVQDNAPTCPSTSEVGTVAVKAPEVTGDLVGKIYLGDPRPGDEAAGIYRLYIYAARGGLAVKFQGTATANAGNGQVVVSITNASSYGSGLPQFNYSKFTMDFNTNSGGVGFDDVGAAVSNPVASPNDAQQMLINPQVCGSYNANVALTPWTSPNEAVVNTTKTLSVTSGTNGSCTFNPFAPTFSANLSNTQAGRHPDLNLTVTRGDRQDNIKNLLFKLPYGFAGSANAVPTCNGLTQNSLGTCTAANALGTAAVTVGLGPDSLVMPTSTIYNVATIDSSQTARLGIVTPAVVGPFDLGYVVSYTVLKLDNSSTFRLSASTDLTQSINGIPVGYRSISLTLNGMAGAVPFLQNPSATCASPLAFDATITSNGDLSGPALPGSGSPSAVVLSDTNQSLDCTTTPQPFTPGMSVTPTTLATAQPTGLNLTLTQPQTAATTQQSTVKNATVTMPTGLEINPGFASSVTACSTATINTDITNATNSCSGPATKIADVTVNTPLLGSTVAGQVYLETPGATPATRYRVVMYLNMPGGMLIIRGAVTLNGSTAGGVSGSTGAVGSGTGQLIATFTNLPDVPWSSMLLAFNSTTPMFVNTDTVGTQTFNGSFVPYSTSSTNPATASGSYLTNYNGTVGSTGVDPWSPTFAQTLSTTAPNAHPDLTMTVSRPEKNQQLSSIDFGLPSGLTGAPAAVPTCTQVLADAANCPATSRVGTVTATVGSALVATPGVGLATLSGNLYNTVAPATAPAKLTAVVPVVLGPFNLGSMTLPVGVAMRPATDPDPYGLTASVTLPNRYEGVKIRYRSLQVLINGVAPGNGANFLTNPSNCGATKTTTATMTSELANVATGTQNFTVGACAGGFTVAPTITVATNPVTPPAQSPIGITANVASATSNPTMKQIKITMPTGVSLNAAVGNNGVNTTCSTANINADTCGAATVYGTATMTTPLIAGTFNGNIYLETPTLTGSPDERYRVAIIVALPGQKLIIRGKIRVNGDSTVTAGGLGTVDTGTGIVTADFDNLPDLSFNTFNVNFNSGSRAVMVAPSTCSSTNTITGQLFPYNNPATSVSNNSNFNNNSPCVATTFAPTFSASVTNAAAAGNPDLTMAVTNAGANVDTLRTITYHMPTGFVANTNNVARCTQAVATAGNCATPAVGTATIVVGTNAEGYSMSGSVYNVTPNANEPARLQAIIPINIGPFVLGKFSTPVGTTLRPDYGIDATATLPLKYEGIDARARSLSVTLNGTVGGQPFVQNPSVCQTVNNFNADISNGVTPQNKVSPSFTINGCPKNFVSTPTLSVTPSTTLAADPVGLTFNIGSAATNPTMKRVQIDFPAGMDINPAFANGLTTCTAPTVAGCASANSIATVSLTTPLLSTSPVTGNVYVVAPGNTAATRYKVVMIVDLPGTNELIVQGAVTVNGSTDIPTASTGATGSIDTGTGQIKADFNNIPDLGFTNLTIVFNSGTRAMAVNPETNVSTSFTGTFTNNAGGTDATATSAYTTTGASTAFNPSFTASATSYVANAHPTLTMNIARADKSKQLKGMTIHFPVGLTANTAGVPQCTQASAAAASCASTQPTSQVGTLPSVTIGSGTETYNVTGGKIFEVVPNATEPARFQAIIPVLVGPYNLGNMTVPISGSLRSDYGIDLATTLPVRYEGIAVRIQTMQMVINGTVNAANFMNNPTKCNAGTISADFTAADASADSSTANNSSAYTATGCPIAFGSAPSVAVSGISTSTQTPTGMTVSVNSATGNPTVGDVQVTLPAGMSLNPAVGNNGANTTCATATIDAITAASDLCPAAAQQGTVSLTSPLLNGTFSGKVYLEDPGNTAATRYKLAIAVSLPGRMLIVHGGATVNGSTTIPGGGLGSVDTGTGVVVADFPTIPDLAFSNLTLSLTTSNRSMLITPSTCQAGWVVGTSVSPNGGGAAAIGSQNFTTSVNCTQSFAPTFTASVSAPGAAANADLTLAVTNPGATVDYLRNATFHMPTGFVAYTNNVARCSQVNATAGTCATPVVGSATAAVGGSAEQYSLSGGSVYNVTPNATEPARLQAVIPVAVGPYNLGNLSIPVSTSLRADQGIDATAQLPKTYEGIDIRVRSLSVTLLGTVGGQPFMQNPSVCQTVNNFNADLGTGVTTVNKVSGSFAITGCPKNFTSSPTLAVTTSTPQAGDPVGLTFNVTSAVNNPTIKRVQIDFPVGMEINPAFANGLTTCSAPTVAGCATANSIGTVSLTTPLLSTGPVTGNVYVVGPGNTGATRYKVVMIVDLPGTNELIVQGAVTVNGSSDIPTASTGATGSVDTGTGQIKADFNNMPDLGFTNLTMAFNSGTRAMVVNADTNVSTNFTGTFTPNSGGIDATGTSAYTTSGAISPFNPSFTATSSSYVANAHPTLTMNIARADKSKQLKGMTIHLPAGLTANTTAVPQCTQASAAAASCATTQPTSQVGTLPSVAIGSGTETYNVTGGKIFAVVPNATEPARFQAVIPVLVGPYNLGNMTVPISGSLRGSDYGIDLATTLPVRYEGIAVRIQTMQMIINGTVNAANYMNNPSKCAAGMISADFTAADTSADTSTANNSSVYTATGCPVAFGTNPTVAVSGISTSTQTPTGMTVSINSVSGNPSVGAVQLTLPAGMSLNPAVGNNAANTTCATAVIDAITTSTDLCPAGAQQGTVSLTSPLLSGTFSGKVYLESPGTTAATRYKLAIVVALPGQMLIVHGGATVDGSTTIPTGGTGAKDSGTGVITATFPSIPDLAFTNLTLNLTASTRSMLITPSTCQAGWVVGTSVSPNGGGAAAVGTQNFTTSVNCAQTFAPTFSGTLSSYVAGANPNLTIAVTNGGSTVNAIRNLNVKLPVGLVANTNAVARCLQVDATAGACGANTPSSAVGTISVGMGASAEQLSLSGTVYNVTPGANEPAHLAASIPVLVGPFNLGNLPVDISTALNDGAVNPARTYAVDTFSTLPTRYEGIDVRVRSLNMTINGTVGGQPFMINPSACLTDSIGADIISPDPITVSRTTAATFTGCNRPYTTNPSLTVTPSTTQAGQPVGLQFDLGTTLLNPTTQDIKLNFPTGFELNPAAGIGLTACSAANLATTPGQTTCDGNGSRLGTVTLTTPLLTGPQSGAVYLEQPGNTATTRYKTAIVVKLPGKDLILHGAITLNGSTTIPTGGTGAVDSGTGQISADFPGIPDLGFTNMRVAFNGVTPLFVNPQSCSLATFSADWTPTGTGAVKSVTSGYTPDTNCSNPLPFAPTFNGSVAPTTSAANPNVTLNFTRPDNNRNLRNITVGLPTGLVAATSATTLCSQTSAAAATCGSGQIVGTVSTTIGSGSPTFPLAGSLYNVQPNATEPARFAAVMPVVVGPFDLGKLSIPVPTTLRADLGVDATAQLPVRYEGIAVHIRTLTMVLAATADQGTPSTLDDKPFMINPSKCQSNTVNASMVSDGASPATVASSFNFTTGSCAGFGTAPTLAVAGSTAVPADPVGLTFTINSAATNPTMKRVQITFPSGMEVNPAFGTGLTACATATIDAGGAGCAGSSQLATVTMVTPLLNSNPTGKVYLETPGTTSTTRYKVAMVVDLPGQKLIVRGAIQINGSTTIPTGGTGAVDSGTGQISADFDNIPDLGFTSLTLAFNSGANALAVNPETCANTFNATFTPNSNTGATSSSSPSYTLSGCGAFGFDPGFNATVDNTTPGGHPNLGLNVTRSDKQKTLKSMAIHLPTGLVANTSAVVSPCSQASAAAATCATTAAAAQVGTFTTSFGSGPSTFALAGGKIFQVTPNSNEPVRFGAIVPVVVGPFDLGNLTIPVTSSIRADYGIDANATLPQRYEGIAVRLRTLNMTLNSTVGGNNYVTNPSKCQSNAISADFTAGDNSADSSAANNSSTYITAGCSATVPAYSPTISASVNPTTAGNPTALTLGVQVPVGSATTSRVQVDLPAGMELNPAIGNGLVACSTIDADPSSSNPCKLTSSNLATVTLTTPLLPGTVTGEVYLETPGATAATRYKLALVIHLPGKDMLIHGGTLVNGSTTIAPGGLGSTDAAGTATGQVTADFPGIPDLGFTNMSIAFNSGSKLFVNPKTAGTFTVNGTLTPNSVATTKSASATFTTTAGTSATLGWNPTFSASISPSTSASNPNLTLNLGNPLGMQELKSFGVKLPVGLVANTTAVPRCSQANADAGNCAAPNMVGTVSTTFGSSDTVGQDYTVTGTIYNVIPNADQPARLQAIVPIQVGPFDLGKLSIPVPTSLNSDLTVTASASLPSRYEGIAVRVRAMQMVIQGQPNGNKFMVAPTKCGSSNITGTLTSDTSNVSTLSSAINVTGCPTNFGASPAFSVTPDTNTRTTPVNLAFQLTSAANNPTIGRVQVAMPLGMEINPGFANNLTACSTASVDAGGSTCPPSSQIGTVSLKTQLLDPTTAYTGKVYLETPGNTASTRYKIALVVDLPGAKLIVHGKVSINGSSTIPTGGTGAVDSGTGQIIADFDTIPDLGFTELNMAFNSSNPMLINPQTCTSNTFTATVTPSSNGTDAAPTAAYSTTPAGCSDSFSPNFSVSVDGASTTAAGGHPDLGIHVDRPAGTNALNQRYLRQLNLDLPIGLVAATTATSNCSQANALAGNCTSNELVGTFDTFIGNGAADANNLELAGQIYNVTPNPSEPARLAAITDVQVGPYNLGKLVIPIGTQLNSDLSVSTTTTIPRRYEGIAVRIKKIDISLMGIAPSTGKPFISVPSKCQNNTVTANMLSDTGTAAARTSSFTTTGCPRNFVVAPTVGVTSNPSDTTVPTGLGVTIGSDPQNSTISRFQLALPNDMSINADAGNGLSTCSAALINAGGSGCPASSNQGTVTLTTPLLGANQTGNVYLEDPGATGATRYKLAIVIHLPGTDMILRGKVLVDGSTDITSGVGSTDTGTGRITTDFDTIPDLQFTQMVISFNTGNRALLTNPDSCGTQTTNSTITPSSGGTDAAVVSTFSLTNTLGCAANKPFNPTFTATPASTVSGANTDLALKVTTGAKNEYLRNFNLQLPAGLVADTTATNTNCTQAQAAAATCTAASQVGTVVTKLGTGGETLDLTGGIYNVDPNSSEPARLAAIVPVMVGPYNLGKLTIPVPTSLRSGDYGVNATTLIPTKYEGINVRLAEMSMTLKGQADQGTPSALDDKGFIKNPSKCDATGASNPLKADLVPLTGSAATRSVNYPVTGCPRNFSPNPTLTVSGTTNTTAVPTGMTMQIDSATSNPTVGGVVMTMPLGMTLNPAVANASGGLAACSTATIDSNADACPAGSKIGSVQLVTPLLPGTKTGFVYLETPGGTAATRYKLALVVDLPGTKLIVRGTAAVDGSSNLSGGLGATDGGSPTGRVVATFASIPDLSFTQLKITFNSGPQALFTNAETAGVQTVSAQITPQSGGSTITSNSTYSTVYGGSGSQASEPFSPSFGATFSTLDAAANPDVTITVDRSDYTQQIKDFDLHLPPGLVANTVLTPRCTQANAAAGTCAASSAVGSVSTKIGTGVDTLTMNGTLYNVIPDASEPARLAVVIPVVVGPYNLGKLSLPVTTQIVSGAQASDLSIDTHTTLPKFYEGVPVRIRQLQIKLAGMADQGTPSTSDDKPFMINPSQCTSHTLSATMTSTIGNSVTVGSPGGDFTTINCASAPYNPALTASLSTTQRGKPVGIDLGFQFSGNSSSTKKIVTTFPHGMAINPGVGNYGAGMTCTDVNVQAGGALCSSNSKLGTVSLDTPLLPTTQTGALYLLPPVGNQAATRYRLGLFVDLPGSGDLYTTGSVTVDGSSDVPTGGTGAVDAGDGQVVATFDNLPDLQFNNLTLHFKTTGAGEHALLTNPNTCGTFNIDADMSPWARPLTSATTSASFTTTDNVASCSDTESADQPGYVSAQLGDPNTPATFDNPAGPAYYAGASQPVTMTVNRPDSDKSIKRVKILLPPGLVGSADAAPTCTQVSADAGTCATTVANNASQIGSVSLQIGDSSDTYLITGGLYNTDAPSNRPAKFTFIADVNVGPFAFGKVIVPVDVNLDSNDYSLFAETGDMPQVFEGIPVRISQMKIALVGTADQGTPSTADDKIFMSNPRSCSTTLHVRAVVTSSPGDTTKDADAPLAGPFTNCNSLNLNADTVTIENQPVAPEVGHGAEHPTGLNVQVHQDESLATQATLKNLSLALPGFRLSAPAANGLAACSATQLDNQTCPAASRVGTAWIDTSLLPKNQTSPDGPGSHSLWGAVYLETPGTASDGSDRYKLAIQLTGKTLITIRGIAHVNETTGEITTTFDNLPDIPFTDFRVELTGYKKVVGPTTTYFPLLLNPEGVVGSASTVQTSADLTPHSGTAPVTRNSVLPIDAALAKTFTPTTTTDISPLTSGGHPTAGFTISRGDAQEDIKDVAMQLPAGFLGSAAAVPLCPVPTATAGNCTDQSKVGDVIAKIGQFGQTLTLPGKVYLTEGVNGDIAGMSIKVPAKAGPYDLGDYITQGRIQIRPSDHGITVNFADVPKLFKGVPTHIQNMDITLPGTAASTQKPFLYNASDCSAFNITTSLTPYTGAVSQSSDPYQATGCPARPFSPTISFAATSGGDERTAPSWQIKMHGDSGDSTLKSATVILPSIMTVSAQGLGTACPADQAAARTCPDTSKIGTVSVDTPLLTTPVTGTIYMAKSISGQGLPDMMIDIPAPIDMQIRGANSFLTAGNSASQIKSTFSNLPDLIWSDMTMNITGGPKGILGLRANGVCGAAASSFASHSGQAVNTNSPVTGISGFCQNIQNTCANPTVKVSTSGAKKPGNKKVSTALALSTASNCKEIKAVRVTYPKGTKLNKKLILFNKKKKATKKNLKNVTGRAGSKSLTSKDFAISGSNGLKFNTVFPAGTQSISIKTKNSALLPSYKTFCGDITKKKYPVAKKYKSALKKCQKKNVTFTFEITNTDGTAFRYNYVAPAGSKFFK